MNKKNYIKTGTINKVNRKTGEISVFFDKKSMEINDELKSVFIEIDGGLVPFFVEELRSISNESFRLTLQDYASPDLAQRFVGCKVYLAQTDFLQSSPTDRIDTDELTGFEVYDEVFGKIGVINNCIESPNQVLLQILHGEKEILIPLVEEFLIDLDENKRTILLNLPEGLLDINMEK